MNELEKKIEYTAPDYNDYMKGVYIIANEVEIEEGQNKIFWDRFKNLGMLEETDQIVESLESEKRVFKTFNEALNVYVQIEAERLCTERDGKINEKLNKAFLNAETKLAELSDSYSDMSEYEKDVCKFTISNIEAFKQILSETPLLPNSEDLKNNLPTAEDISLTSDRENE
jgi:hypothetical protein